MKSLLLVLVVTLAVVFMVTPNPHPFARASEKLTGDTLRQTEGELMKAGAEPGSAGYMSYLRRRCGGSAERSGHHLGESEHCED